MCISIQITYFILYNQFTQQQYNIQQFFTMDDLVPLTQKHEQYQPEEEEIKQYAEYLGFNLPEDIHLLWIAREGLMSPLPSGWVACNNAQGELLFKNILTGTIQVDHPLDEFYKNKYYLQKKKLAIMNDKALALSNILEQNQSMISKTDQLESYSKIMESFQDKKVINSQLSSKKQPTDFNVLQNIISQQSEEELELIGQYKVRLSDMRQEETEQQYEKEIAKLKEIQTKKLKLEKKIVMMHEQHKTIKERLLRQQVKKKQDQIKYALQSHMLNIQKRVNQKLKGI